MKLRTALRLGRVSNLPTIFTNVLAGLTLADASFTVGTYALLSLAMSLAYVGGMYLNDAHDREIDARQRPERPIPSGEVSARTVFVLGYGMLAASVGSCALVAFQAGAARGASPAVALGSSLLLCITIVFYDVHHKQNPLSPVVMGVCRVLVYVTVAACMAAPPPPLASWLGAAALFAYLIGLTYAAKQETRGRIERALPLSLLGLPALTVAFVHDLPGLMLYALFVGAMAYALLRLFGRKRHIPSAIGTFIAGICLLDGTLVAAMGRPLLAMACAAAFALTLALQRSVPGT